MTTLTLNQYQDEALYFRLPTADHIYALLGLTGEVGELNSLIAKTIRDGVDIATYPDKLKSELGDILWFVAAVCKDNGYSLEDIGQTNLKKLSARKLANTLQGSGDVR